MTWLYYTVSPGGPERMDAAVRELVAPAADAIRAAQGCDRWFFIRYFDDRGPHLRLRAHAPVRDDADALQRKLDALLRERLPAVARGQSRQRRPLLPVPAAHATSTARHVGIEQRIYEPEWEKYGGEAGVAVAEQLFQASSDAVLALGGAQLDSGPRAALSLALMSAVARAGVQTQRRAAFWRGYTAFWTTGSTASVTAPAARFVDRAAQRVAPLLAPSCAKLAADIDAGVAIDRYAEAASAMLASAPANTIPHSAEHLCFHHVHMTNNRLGMTLVEEALLTAVLARADHDHEEES